MLFTAKKFFLIFTFNLSLFLILMIGIQNNSNSKKVNLILEETVSLPVSFIVGISFISGSIIGSFINFNYKD